MKKPAIEVTNVTKKYHIHHEKPTLVEALNPFKRTEVFYALNDITLTINSGERVGLIGQNGSGKTTLLKVIAGIATPTSGSVTTNGKVVTLIELEAGFHPDLSGLENIHLNGLLVGMSKAEINRLLPDIIAFADIGSFIDAPFYTYSEGMKLRLSFAIVIHAEPDIMIIDENIYVGDGDFQVKVATKINERFEQGKTMVTVSHHPAFLENNCERLVWLDSGKVIADGPVKPVLKKYLKFLEGKHVRR